MGGKDTNVMILRRGPFRHRSPFGILYQRRVTNLGETADDSKPTVLPEDGQIAIAHRPALAMNKKLRAATGIATHGERMKPPPPDSFA